MKTVLIYKDELLPISETFIQAQASALKRYRVQYVGLFRSKKSLPVLDHAILAVPQTGGSMERLRKILYYRTGIAPRFHRALRACRANLIHAHFAYSGKHASRIAKQLGVPLIVTLHGYDVTVRRDYRSLYRPLWENASLFICVSEYIRSKAIEGGFPADKLRVLYNGIQLNPPQNVIKDQNLIVFIGRLVEKKGCVYLLRSMPMVVQACRDAHLVIIGDGPLREELTREAELLGIPCTFLGAQPSDVVKSYQEKATVVCVPSVTAANGDSEGMPTVILEAIAAGATVVGTSHAGIPEVISDEQTGLLVPEKKTDDLSNALIRALNDKDLRNRCATLGLQLVQQNMEIAKQAMALETIYDELLRTG